MSRRARKRLFAIAAPVVAACVVVLALPAPASAHVVTGIRADCQNVTVGFAEFPDEGVMVHIAVQVGSQAPITRDVLVTSETTDVQVDISAATALLHGATATVEVDVTWKLKGQQEADDSVEVTCGSGATTTSATTTSQGSTTTEASTTTQFGTTTSSTTTTTGTTGSGNTTSTAASIVGGETTTSSAGSSGSTPGSKPGPSVTVLGAELHATTAVAVSAGGGSSLPFTGGTPAPLAFVGLVLLAAGTGFVGAGARRRTARSS